MHRLIVTSATYRQSSNISRELLEKDPANILLARAPRLRVEGEIVRDIALSAAGVLNNRVGGPSVAIQVGRMAAEQHKLCVNHSYKTGISIAASLHFLAALPNSGWLEYCVEGSDLRQTLTKQTFPLVDGQVAVPQEPGLGVEIDEDVLARYRVA